MRLNLLSKGQSLMNVNAHRLRDHESVNSVHSVAWTAGYHICPLNTRSQCKLTWHEFAKSGEAVTVSEIRI